MRFQHTMTYGAPVNEVFAMRTGHAWRKQVGAVGVACRRER